MVVDSSLGDPFVVYNNIFRLLYYCSPGLEGVQQHKVQINILVLWG